MLTNGMEDLNRRKKEFASKNKREKNDSFITRPRSASTYNNTSFKNSQHANEYLGSFGPDYKAENQYHFKRYQKTNEKPWKLTDNNFASLKQVNFSDSFLNSHYSFFQLFLEIPIDVGFNIEIKYPDVLDFKECHAKERNLMVDLILNVWHLFFPY